MRVRVAFAGKGGTGKSALAGTFARALARRGEPVLAIDVDHVPGLAYSLGAPVHDALIPDDAVVPKTPGTIGLPFRLAPGLTAAGAVERYAVHAPDGVRFLQFGNIQGDEDRKRFLRPFCAFRQILDEIPETDCSIVADLAAGTFQAFTGMANCARALLVVVEPTAKSTRSARRLAHMKDLGYPAGRMAAVANKVRTPADVELVRSATGLEVVAEVPFDPAMGAVDAAGRAPIDAAPDAPAVRAVELLVDRVISEEGAR